MVYYNNTLWRFTVDHTAGAWDASEVEAYSMKDLINDINALLGDFQNVLGYSSTKSIMYFYNVFLGPKDMMKHPFGAYEQPLETA